MTAASDLHPVAAAAADYRQAIARLENAAADAESAWRLLPAALDSPGTQLAVGGYVRPAGRLATGLLDSADALHGALLAAAGTLGAVEARAAAFPDDPSWATRAQATEAECAATVAAIHGGEAGSIALPCPDPLAGGAGTMHPASFVAPTAPLGFSLPRLGGAAVGGAEATGAALAAGLLGVLGLVLSLGGSTDSSPPEGYDRRRPRPGVDRVRITPYTPCNLFEHGDGCEERHLGLEKPGDEPFTGEKVRGDEPPGEMPGTREDWVMSRARNDEGWVYEAPNGKSMRVVEPGRDERYPNGYVMFRNTRDQPVDLGGMRTVSPRSDAAHVTRNPDGSFPIPTGWEQ